jgi:hypothetical protein
MLYVRGAQGSAIVRMVPVRDSDTIRCTFLNDSSSVLIRRDTDAHFIADLAVFEGKIVALAGPPTIVSDIPELA